ncbi:unnamed protein product [Strongylus vulgaris]|uniref:Uncharacterized protein n=1 Tax=Strongylus vulgaris TaxID=40348 RepID=A0A3P7J7X8_STRVU|nr:unnamed protein product [Strongylus vulgaris]
MDFGPKGHVNDLPWRLSHALHLQRRTVSTNANFHALLEIARRINYHVIGLREKSTKMDVSQGTLEAVDLSLLEIARRINYHIIGLREKSRKMDVSQLTDDSELDAFSEVLEVIRKANCFYKFVAGAFNAKIGMPEEGEHRIERFGSGLRNENGRKEKHRRWTWESPNGTIKAEIDHILTNQRWCFGRLSGTISQ